MVLNKTEFFVWNETMFSIQQSHLEQLEFLAQHLKIVQAGTPFATAKHDKLIPEHGSSLSIELNKAHFHHIEVGLEEALHFLRKNPSQTDQRQKDLRLLPISNFQSDG